MIFVLHGSKQATYSRLVEASTFQFEPAFSVPTRCSLPRLIALFFFFPPSPPVAVSALEERYCKNPYGENAVCDDDGENSSCMCEEGFVTSMGGYPDEGFACLPIGGYEA